MGYQPCYEILDKDGSDKHSSFFHKLFITAVKSLIVHAMGFQLTQTSKRKMEEKKKDLKNVLRKDVLWPVL
jgi:hypothetical protein